VNENPEPTSGWTFGKVIGVIVGLIGMVGFGVCTLCGTFIAFGAYGDGEVWFMVLCGAGLTALSTWLVMTMFRKVREARELNRNDRNPP
jgi:hypothetical protein